MLEVFNKNLIRINGEKFKMVSLFGHLEAQDKGIHTEISILAQVLKTSFIGSIEYRIISLRGSSGSHYVESSLWKRLWTCSKTDY
jgi:hypothetical protein